MEESEAAEENDYTSETAAAADVDEMPPLEVDEAIAELDTVIDEARDEGEEGPKPLDEADINDAAWQIKDIPTWHLALGLTDPYWASMASMVISYSKLVVQFGINKDQLQEVSVMGKLQ